MKYLIIKTLYFKKSLNIYLISYYIKFIVYPMHNTI